MVSKNEGRKPGGTAPENTRYSKWNCTHKSLTRGDAGTGLPATIRRTKERGFRPSCGANRLAPQLFQAEPGRRSAMLQAFHTEMRAFEKNLESHAQG
jgi:hypothetical protein